MIESVVISPSFERAPVALVGSLLLGAGACNQTVDSMLL